MDALRAVKSAGGETTIRNAAVEGLRSRLRGDLLRPGNADYEVARRVFNAMIDKRPALIVRCLHTSDVAHAVGFARRHDLLVAVRSGGHNVAGKAMCDGGLAIDLSALKTVVVDPQQRIARAAAGLTLGELDRATHAHGLATPLGVVSMTGIAGLTLGGGIGRLNGKYGLTCDNLLAAEVVAADGNVVRTNANEHGDLFWALRGGGGNFGIVTAFEYQLHP